MGYPCSAGRPHYDRSAQCAEEVREGLHHAVAGRLGVQLLVLVGEEVVDDHELVLDKDRRRHYSDPTIDKDPRKPVDKAVIVCDRLRLSFVCLRLSRCCLNLSFVCLRLSFVCLRLCTPD